MRFWLLLAFMVPSLSSIAVAQSTIGVLCIAKNGAIAVRSKCLPSETAASLDDLTEKGSTGHVGPTGPSGIPGRVVAYTNRGTVILNASEGASFSEYCPAGKIAVGGGCYSSSTYVAISRSYPNDGSPNGWDCTFVPRVLGVSPQLITYAVCMDQ